MRQNGRKEIEIPATITVRELAALMSVSPIDVIKVLMHNGIMASINQRIDYETAALVAHEFGFEPREQRPPEAVEEEGPSLLWQRLYAGRIPPSSSRGRRWWWSSGMWITGRPPCWMPSGAPT
jgi:translation initiation factor IF-2